MKAQIPSITAASQVYKKERPVYVILSIFLLLQDHLFISIFSRDNSIDFHGDVSNTFLWGKKLLYKLWWSALSLRSAVDSYDVSFLGNIYCILYSSLVFVI